MSGKNTLVNGTKKKGGGGKKMEEKKKAVVCACGGDIKNQNTFILIGSYTKIIFTIKRTKGILNKTSEKLHFKFKVLLVGSLVFGCQHRDERKHER